MFSTARDNPFIPELLLVVLYFLTLQSPLEMSLHHGQKSSLLSKWLDFISLASIVLF